MTLSSQVEILSLLLGFLPARLLLVCYNKVHLTNEKSSRYLLALMERLVGVAAFSQRTEAAGGTSDSGATPTLEKLGSYSSDFSMKQRLNYVYLKSIWDLGGFCRLVLHQTSCMETKNDDSLSVKV